MVRQAAEAIAEFGARSSERAGKSSKLKHAGLKLADELLSGAIITRPLVEIARNSTDLCPGTTAEANRAHFFGVKSGASSCNVLFT